MSDKKDTRRRVWSSILYPESAKENWEEILKSTKVPCIVSPLHDKDVWTAEDEIENPLHIKGTLKKPHYHLMFLFSGKKSYDQVRELCDMVGSTFPISVESASGMAAYMTHEFDDDKFKYDKADVKCFNGASYVSTMSDSKEFKDIIIGEMLDWCDENGIYSYAQLMRFAKHERPDWFHVLNHSSTNQMLAFLRSKAWEDKLINSQ